MEKLELTDFDGELPNRMAVAVVMEKKPSTHPWADYAYDAIGVVVKQDAEAAEPSLIFKDGEIEHHLFGGLGIQLHVDECESYYHNMMSPEPGCFIVAETPEDPSDMPEPYLVSLSFDEVHAYLEGDEQVYSVPIPPELYKWAEAYVLTHYVAIKKTKRKLKNWSEPPAEGGQS